MAVNCCSAWTQQKQNMEWLLHLLSCDTRHLQLHCDPQNWAKHSVLVASMSSELLDTIGTTFANADHHTTFFSLTSCDMVEKGEGLGLFQARHRWSCMATHAWTERETWWECFQFDAEATLATQFTQFTLCRDPLQVSCADQELDVMHNIKLLKSPTTLTFFGRPVSIRSPMFIQSGLRSQRDIW